MSVVRAYRFSPLQTFTLCVWCAFTSAPGSGGDVERGARWGRW